MRSELFGSSDEFGFEDNFTIEEMRRMVATSREIPDELKDLIAKEIAKRAPREDVWKNRQVAFQKGVFGGKYWAIRRDNLRPIEVLAGTALAITTYVAVVGASPAVFAVTLIFAAVALSDRLKSKAASLRDDQYRILMILKAVGPTTVTHLAELMSGLHIYGRDVWTEDKVLEALDKLKAVHLGDGSIEALVTQASDGLWAANGI